MFACVSLSTQIIDIEKEIDYGQIEELIEIANEELGLIEYYHGERLAIGLLALLAIVLILLLGPTFMYVTTSPGRSHLASLI